MNPSGSGWCCTILSRAIVLSIEACLVYIFQQTPITGIGAVGALESTHWPKISSDIVLVVLLGEDPTMLHLSLLLLLPISLTQV